MNFPRSAYLHIPFCHRRCFYCDFPVVPLGDKANALSGTGSSSIKSYLNLLHREISLAPSKEPLSTIYIGGGTPSLLSPCQVASLLDHLRVHFGFQNGAEVTLEIDPASFDNNALEGYLDAGVNRLSLGAQSFDNKNLQELGRRHTAEQLLDACTWIVDNFKRGNLLSWSLDLIQNLPEHDLTLWKEQLVKTILISPPHVSVYDLSIEKGTVFEKRRRKGTLTLPEEELSYEISRMTSEMLNKAGLSRYEISNYALPGHASRHNRVYWSGSGWWGFGQGATSCLWGKRFSRPRTREGYKLWLDKKELEDIGNYFPYSLDLQSIPLDDLMIVGLRRREGIDFKRLVQKLNWTNHELERNFNSLKMHWDYALRRGWMKQSGYRFYLTDPEGMEISNQILVDMLLWWEPLKDSAYDPPIC